MAYLFSIHIYYTHDFANFRRQATIWQTLRSLLWATEKMVIWYIFTCNDRSSREACDYLFWSQYIKDQVGTDARYTGRFDQYFKAFGLNFKFCPPPVHVVGPIAPLLLGQILCQVSVKYSGGPKDRGCVPKKWKFAKQTAVSV